MAVYTTNTLTRLPSGSMQTIVQAVVKIVNSGTADTLVYLTGLNNDNNPESLFAQELLELTGGSVVTRTYNITFNFFQFNVYYSQDLLGVEIFLIDTAGVYQRVDMKRVDLSRITSEFRDNLEVTDTPFAAISFRRSPTLTVPEAVASQLQPDGVQILASTPIRYSLVAGGTVNGTFVSYPTPTTIIPTNATALQVNYTCTAVTGGRVITQGIGSGIAGAYQSVTLNLRSEQLSYSLREEPLTLVVSSLAGADSVAAVFRMAEQW